MFDSTRPATGLDYGTECLDTEQDCMLFAPSASTVRVVDDEIKNKSPPKALGKPIRKGGKKKEEEECV